MKRKFLSTLLATALGLALLCTGALAADCDHSAINDSGYCSGCNTQFVAKDANGNFYAFLSNCQYESGTYTLLADVSGDFYASLGTQITLDLNGHSLDGTAYANRDVYGDPDPSTLTIKDSKGGGSVTKVTEGRGGYVNVESGHIKTLSLVYNYTTLKGGTYDKIESEHWLSNLDSLLPASYVFRSTADDTVITLTDELTELTNVKVEFVTCTRHTAPNSIGKCANCQQTITTSRKTSTDTFYYLSLDDAIVAAQAGDTVTLLQREDIDKTITDAPKFTLDLNGYFFQSLTLENSPILLINTNGEWNSFRITVSGEGMTVGKLLPEGWGLYDYGYPTSTWYDSSATDTSLSGWVRPLPLQSVSITPDKESYTGGDSITLTGTVTKPESNTSEVTYQWYQDENPVGTSKDLTLPSLDVGKHTFQLKATSDSYTLASAVLEIDMGKAALTPEQNPKAQQDLVYTGQPQALIDASAVPAGCTVQYRLSESAAWSDDIPTGKEAGTYTVYCKLDGGTNYDITQPNPTFQVTIDRKTVQPTVTVTSGSKYTGSAQTPAVTLQDGQTTIPESEYTVTYSSNVSAGQGRVTVTCGSGGNYAFETVNDNFPIAKGDAPTSVRAQGINTVYTVTYGTADLSQLISGIPSDAGTVSYAVDTSALSSGCTASIGEDEKTLSFAIPGPGEKGFSYGFPVIVSSTNYENITATIIVHLVAKTEKQLAVTMAGWTYGETAKEPSYATASDAGQAEVQYKAKDAGDNTYAATVPTNAGEYTVKVSYETRTEAWSGQASFTIAKATPPQPTFGTVSAAGKTLNDVTWSVADTITATLTWDDGTDTEIEQGKSYGWTLTPTGDSAQNYTTLPGSCIPWPAASSSSPTTYSIQTTATSNGSVKAQPKKAAKGATVTLTVTPDEGYELKSLTILDKNGNEVDFTEKNGKITFQMPAGAVTVTPIFAKTAEKPVQNEENPAQTGDKPAQTFGDVAEDAYYAHAVAWAVERGITTGTGENTFSPTLPCTRAELVTFLWRAAGSPAPQGVAGFDDVTDKNAFYTDAIAWAVEQNLVKGCGNNTFSPENAISREELAVILYRFVQSQGGGFTGAWAFRLPFDDVADISDWAVEAVSWCYKEGIMQGFANNFMANAVCNRAQIATTLYRLLGK